jgi:DNA-binding GntR family transcriptional regulator
MSATSTSRGLVQTGAPPAAVALAGNAPAAPRYRQVADDLKARIKKGDFAVGTLLPTELDICQTYDVSRHTARESLRILAEDGLVERRQGHGTRVVSAEPHTFSRSISSIPDLLQYGANTRLQIKSTARVPADERISRLLGCAIGTRCVRLHGVRSERNARTPFCVSDIYRVATPDALTKRLASVKGAVYAIIDELALDHIGRVEQHISAGRMSAETAALLAARPKDPTLIIVRRYFDRDDRLILVALNQHRSNDFVYSMVLNRN